MGKHEGWVQPNGILLNGVLTKEAASITQVLDPDRWSKAEERTAELISCIQPNQPSEQRRHNVALYVKELIQECFLCEVFTFGSVPLKTYLPDGDIDLTAFSTDPNLKDTWAQEVRDILGKEEKKENAKFRVKEVQYIQAEVRIIKCLVENIVVDISFNQLGGLCTLRFLDQMDHLINENHLFKRSIILIKAWCYYESRILGAHHGLISTYALETLVLYIFHVFNNSFAGPLEVLYRFLVFFSNFDWNNFCLSLWGPVPISILPDMIAEPPRRDSSELLLSKEYLDSCSSVHAVSPGGQETQNQPFVSKYFNVIDPLRTNNNLGRSVSKGNFYRIRSAFRLGAKMLARILECPKENLIAEINQFFMNTWERHGSGDRPDASLDSLHPHPLNPCPVENPEKKHHIISKRRGDDCHGTVMENNLASIDFLASDLCTDMPEFMLKNTQASLPKIENPNALIHTSSKLLDQISKITISEKSKKICQPGYRNAENERRGKYTFARTRSSPELVDASAVLTRERSSGGVEVGKNRLASSKGRNKYLVNSEVSTTGHNVKASSDDPSFLKHTDLPQSLENATDSDGGCNGTFNFASASESIELHYEEQDSFNMMTSSRPHNLDPHIPVPFNMPSHLPFPLTPHILAPVGYAPRHISGMIPANFAMIDPRGSNVHFPPGMMSSAVPHYFPTVDTATNTGEMIEHGNENPGIMEAVSEDSESFWNEQVNSINQRFDLDRTTNSQSDYKQQSSPSVEHSVSSQVGPPVNCARSRHKCTTESRGITGKDKLRSLPHHNNLRYERSSEHAEDMRFVPTCQPSSSRSKTASESSSDCSSTRNSRLARDRRGKRSDHAPVSSTLYEKITPNWQYECSSSDHVSSQADDDGMDWASVSTTDPMAAERSMGSGTVTSHSANQQLAGYEPSQLNGPDSVIPLAPVVFGPTPRARSESSGIMPIAFYATGPPVPFLAMVPVYNVQADPESSDGSMIQFDEEAEMEDAGSTNQIGTNIDPAGDADETEGHFPWDGPSRPIATNMNIFTQLVGYGPRLLPVSNFQPGPSRPPPSIYQRYGEEVSRYRGGTGTYLPNPKMSYRERPYTNIRNNRGSYNYDHADKEGNWGGNSKMRGSVRSHARMHSERYDQSRFTSCQAQHGCFTSTNTMHSTPAMAYGMYPLPGVPANGLVPAGPAMPSVVMFYPYDHSMDGGSSHPELVFGSLGPMPFSRMGEESQVGDASTSRAAYEQKLGSYPVSPQSSPDRPSSPQIQREV